MITSNLFLNAHSRLDNWRKSKEQTTVGVLFRAAQLYHSSAMEEYKFVLPAFIAGAEMVIIGTLFIAIRLHAYEEPFFTLSAFGIATACFFIHKKSIEFAAKITEASQDFSRIPFMEKGCQLGHKDRLFLSSCKPLVLRVGSTFTITKDTFPTISNDVIMGTLINCLITF
jgi:hypothetical protein